MGKGTRHRDELTFIERLLCCCKCRAEAKTRLTQFCIYFVLIFVFVGMAALCITVGLLYRESCCYSTVLPYWLLTGSCSPLLLLLFAKAIKQDTEGVTIWRTASLLGYGLFLGWLIAGCVMVYHTWLFVFNTCTSYCDVASCNTCDADSCEGFMGYCDLTLVKTAFAVTIIHWVFAILAAIPNVYIISKILCCHSNNTVKPLKH